MRVGITSIAIAVLMSAGFAFAASPITDLGTLGGDTVAQGINDDGVVVGGWRVKKSPTVGAESLIDQRAFVYRPPGPMKDLGTLGGKESCAYKINSRGDIIGNSLNADAKCRAFVYRGQGMKDIGAVDTGKFVGGINSRGEIAVSLLRPSGSIYAARYSGGATVDLGWLYGDFSYAKDINDAGEVVGRSDAREGERAFRIRRDGPMENLGTLGGNTSTATAINSRGVIVGYSEPKDSKWSHAFRYSGAGPMKDLCPTGKGSFALQINDGGVVVGSLDWGRAVLWLADDTMVDLEAWLDKIDPEAGARWSLVQANDINNRNQVVGYGTIDADNDGMKECRGFVLDVSSIVKGAGDRNVREFEWGEEGKNPGRR